MEKDTDSTLTSLDENTENLCDNPTRDTLAEGIVSLFQPIIDKLDERVRSTRCVRYQLSDIFHLFLHPFIKPMQCISLSIDWHNRNYQSNWTV